MSSIIPEDIAIRMYLGHNKSAAMTIEPYKTYYSSLDGELSSAMGLLVIGYNFNQNDMHLNNRLIANFKSGNNRKVCIIDYINDKKIADLNEKISNIFEMPLPFDEKVLKVFHKGFWDVSDSHIDDLNRFFIAEDTL